MIDKTQPAIMDTFEIVKNILVWIFKKTIALKIVVYIIERCVSPEMIETKTRKDACIRIKSISMQSQRLRILIY